MTNDVADDDDDADDEMMVHDDEDGRRCSICYQGLAGFYGEYGIWTYLLHEFDCRRRWTKQRSEPHATYRTIYRSMVVVNGENMNSRHLVGWCQECEIPTVTDF